MASPAENAATVREALDETCPHEYAVDCDLPEHQTTVKAHAALDALLAQAETAARVREERADWMMRAQDAWDERDAAVRAAEQAQEALRPFVEDYDFHAAGYLSDDDEARVFTARTVESLIAHQRAARAALTGEGTE